MSNNSTILSRAIGSLESNTHNTYYRVKSILTDAESVLYRLMLREFNSKLNCINKSVVIFSKVRIADIINVNKDVKNHKKLFYDLAYKHIDFVICDAETLDIVCAVELDDVYHNREDRQKRDILVNRAFSESGIRLFRIGELIRLVDSESISNVTDYILDYFKPTCEKCGMMMEPKRSNRRSNFGHRFYGCTGWRPGGYGCRHTIDID